jgi:hypothetical protein
MSFRRALAAALAAVPLVFAAGDLPPSAAARPTRDGYWIVLTSDRDGVDRGTSYVTTRTKLTGN